ncbi:MAG: heme-copper oxidase subunit III [Chloroflexi bacterium]|nr:heme-copper oxidase subunit III [Chloroflexota bacterium]
MTAHTLAPARTAPDEGLKRRLSLWLFFVSETMMFGSLILVRFHLWGPGRVAHLDQVLGLDLTTILLLSSGTMAHAEALIGKGDRKGFVRYIAATLILGLLFLVGLGYEWAHAPFGPTQGVFGAVFFTMTGMHGAHVLGGVIFLFIVLLRGLRGRYSAESHWGAEACAMYWHFVDVVWVFYYMVLYLL